MNHLKEHNITYLSHFKKATYIGIRMIISGFCCCIHAFAPFTFTNTASDTIKKINEEIS